MGASFHKFPHPSLEEVFEQFTLTHPPIIIGGRVLEYYHIRETHDVDMVLHPDDYKRFTETPDDQTRKFLDFRGNIGGVDVFLTIATQNYDSLKGSALETETLVKGQRFVFKYASLQKIKDMKQYVIENEHVHIQQIEKAKRDIQFIDTYLVEHPSS